MTQPTVRVTATGSAQVVPDQVRIAVAVEATADTVGQALQQASAGVARLSAVLDDAGVPPGDRVTSGLGVQPAWDRAGDRPQGHTASYGLQLVVHDLDAAGRLVQTAAEQVGDVLPVHAGDQQVVVAVTGTWALDVGAPGPA